MTPVVNRSHVRHRLVQEFIDEPTLFTEELIWRGGRWQRDVESYVNPGFMNSVDMREEDLNFILQEYGIPEGLVPPESIAATSPTKLELLNSALTELGGSDKIRHCFAALAREGIIIEGYVGGGGWGHVFRVSHKEVSTKALALKILKPPYNEEWRLRFDREARILQKLEACEGIARLIEPVREIEGLLFLQTEFVEGVPLSEIELPLEPLKVVALIRCVLQILEFVHKSSVIHRDVHLGNVIDTGNRIVLLDFGLARDEGSSDYYKSFKPVGAMSHCAPEKWLSPSTAGAASDIFSVGVMFYKLLTGAMPFWADTYIGLYEQVKSGRYQRASKIGPEFPDCIDLVLQEMLYPSLIERVPNAAAALNLLQQIEPTLQLWDRQRKRQYP